MRSVYCPRSVRGNFCVGLTTGVIISCVIMGLSLVEKNAVVYRAHTFQSIQDEPEQLGSVGSLHDHLEGTVGSKKLIKLQEDEHIHHDDDTVAKDLYNRVRVLCWVMTGPNNLDKKAIHVKRTWGKRCNKLLFFSSVTNSSFPTIGLNVPEGREHLTAKTRGAFDYIYEHHRDEADWFMKCDDDTYVILENLRYFLSNEDPSEPIYFGHHFRTIVKQGYFSGGAGYVLSKEALRRLATNTSVACKKDGGAEDAELGKCMQNLGVKVGNSTDSLGRSRFHCFDWGTHVMGGYPAWYYKSDALGGHKGEDSMSDYAISFHYLSPGKMYSLEYLLYHLRPYGIKSGLQDLNHKKPGVVDPKMPGVVDPKKPGVVDPKKPGVVDPKKPGVVDPKKPGDLNNKKT